MGGKNSLFTERDLRQDQVQEVGSHILGPTGRCGEISENHSGAERNCVTFENTQVVVIYTQHTVHVWSSAVSQSVMCRCLTSPPLKLVPCSMDCKTKPITFTYLKIQQVKQPGS